MKIISYEDKYRNQTIAHILYLQNYELQSDDSIESQPEILDIPNHYQVNGGDFWLAVNDNEDVVGTIALMVKPDNPCGILKKFFVAKDYRGKGHGISASLYQKLVNQARSIGLNQLVLDTPENADRAHRFYQRQGFRPIAYDDLPVSYNNKGPSLKYLILDL